MASKPRVVVVGGGFAGCGVAHDKQLYSEAGSNSQAKRKDSKLERSR